MGLLLGKTMDENLKKNQQFMMETQRLTLERQIHMQNLMRERMMATQLSRSRDLFYWYSSFYSVALLGAVARFRHSKSPVLIAPMVPLTFILAYQWDLCYGNKLDRIRAGAEKILANEIGLIEMPTGIPTIDELEHRRLDSK